jgi:hypothetical protein
VAQQLVAIARDQELVAEAAHEGLALERLHDDGVGQGRGPGVLRGGIAVVVRQVHPHLAGGGIESALVEQATGGVPGGRRQGVGRGEPLVMSGEAAERQVAVGQDRPAAPVLRLALQEIDQRLR